MLDFIKDYGVSNMEYETIIHSLKKDILDDIYLASDNVKDNLDFYNSLGLSKNLYKIIIKRPDLILMSKEHLVELFNKIDKNILVRIIDKDIDDLILFGI